MSQIEYVESTEFESRYKCSLEYDSVVEKYCEITYDVRYGDFNRNLILLRGNSDLAQKFLSKNKSIKQEYDEILENLPSVLDMTEKRMSKTERTKEYVNKLFSQLDLFDNNSVAVYKFGYVPVLKIPGSKVSSNCKYDIGIYPQEKQESGHGRKKYGYPPGISTDTEFLKSIAIEPLKLFKKYLDDIGELFHLIEHSSRVDHILRLCKEIEELKGESIDSKLRKVYPEDYVENPEDYKKQSKNWPKIMSQKKIVALRNHPIFFMARFARQLSMLMVNEVYRIIGLEDKITKYQNRLIHIESEYNSTFKNDNKVSQLSFLIKLLNSYENKIIKERQNSNRGLELQKEYPTPADWERRFGEFLLFINALKLTDKKSYGLKPSIPRIFISHQHDINTSEKLLEQISDYTKNDSCSVLALREKRADKKSDELYEQFKRLCRAKIWLSDKVYVILPNEGKAKGFKWLIMEMEHTLVTRKDNNSKYLYYFKENGFSNNSLLDDLESLDFDFLSLEFRRKGEDRVNVIQNHFEKLNNSIDFDFYDKRLDDKIQDHINEDLTELPYDVTTDVIVGFISQFTSKEVLYRGHNNYGWLICIMDYLTSNGEKVSIERLLTVINKRTRIIVSTDKIKSILSSLRAAFEKRKLKMVDESSIPLVRISRDCNSFKGNLDKLIVHFLPSASVIDIKNIKQNVYKVFMTEKE